MQRLEARKVHEYAKVPGTQAFRLARINPILRIARAGVGEDGNTSVLCIQRGTVFTEGGQVMKRKDLPQWFHDELAKCSPAALAECGWKSTEAGEKAS